MFLHQMKLTSLLSLGILWFSMSCLTPGLGYAATGFLPVLLQLQGLLLLKQGEQTSPCLPSQSMEQQEKGSVHGNPGTQSSQAESPNCC